MMGWSLESIFVAMSLVIFSIITEFPAYLSYEERRLDEMRKKGFWIFGMILILVLLSGCNEPLPIYDDTLERRVYGASLAEKEVEKLEK